MARGRDNVNCVVTMFRTEYRIEIKKKEEFRLRTGINRVGGGFVVFIIFLTIEKHTLFSIICLKIQSETDRFIVIRK